MPRSRHPVSHREAGGREPRRRGGRHPWRCSARRSAASSMTRTIPPIPRRMSEQVRPEPAPAPNHRREGFRGAARACMTGFGDRDAPSRQAAELLRPVRRRAFSTSLVGGLAATGTGQRATSDKRRPGTPRGRPPTTSELRAGATRGRHRTPRARVDGRREAIDVGAVSQFEVSNGDGPRRPPNHHRRPTATGVLLPGTRPWRRASGREPLGGESRSRTRGRHRDEPALVRNNGLVRCPSFTPARPSRPLTRRPVRRIHGPGDHDPARAISQSRTAAGRMTTTAAAHSAKTGR